MTHEQMQTASSANKVLASVSFWGHEQVETQCPSTHLHHTLPAQPPLPPAPPLRGKKQVTTVTDERVQSSESPETLHCARAKWEPTLGLLAGDMVGRKG